MFAYVVAALAFSAPPSASRTRREMMVGVGAAAAAMVQFPAFAEEKKFMGPGDKRKAEALAAAKAKEGVKTEYQKIIEASKATEAEEAKRKSEFYALIKTDTKLAEAEPNLRKSTDPNACSPECKAKRLAKYGY